MLKTPPPVSLAAAHALPPPADRRSAEAFRDGDLEIRFAAHPSRGPQVPHDKDEFYIVASGTGHYRWDGGETAVAAGDLLFAAAGSAHGFYNTTDDFAIWVVFYGAPR